MLLSRKKKVREGCNMPMNFIPDENQDVGARVPFYEDARADYAPYYSTSTRRSWSVSKAKLALQAEMSKLGGTIIEYLEGSFEGDKPRRGFIIKFVLNGKPGRLTVACLPLRRWTQVRHDAARIQALLIIRDWLKAQVTSMIFSPGNNPLIPHLLNASGQTLAEMIADHADLDLPRLEAGVIEGEVVE